MVPAEQTCQATEQQPAVASAGTTLQDEIRSLRNQLSEVLAFQNQQPPVQQPSNRSQPTTSAQTTTSWDRQRTIDQPPLDTTAARQSDVFSVEVSAFTIGLTVQRLIKFADTVIKRAIS